MAQTEPTAHQRLTRAGLSARFADLVLERHAAELAEKIRDHDYDPGEVGPIHLTYQDAADLIDPKAQR